MREFWSDFRRECWPLAVCLTVLTVLALGIAAWDGPQSSPPAAVTVDPTDAEAIYRLVGRFYDIRTRQLEDLTARVESLETTPSSVQRQIDDDRQDIAELRMRIQALEGASGPGGGRGGGGSPRFP